ncbi:MAG TPA: SDR family NAD(P)-dependent oxidoreductase [Gaiellales bacterium]
MSRSVVAITGASLGVGRACAAELARQGYDVALIARGADSLEAAHAEIGALGDGRVLGPIDVWVNVVTTSVFVVTLVHLPAMNTPQCRQVRSKRPHEPQPVPPLYQPAVAARAVVRAAEHPRREHRVGLPTVAAIVGRRIAPGPLDRYLARTGFASQQTTEPADRERPDDLDHPFPGDLGVAALASRSDG